MKKIRDLVRRWRSGEELEFEGEINLHLGHLIVFLALVVALIVTIVRLLK